MFFGEKKDFVILSVYVQVYVVSCRTRSFSSAVCYIIVVFLNLLASFLFGELFS